MLSVSPFGDDNMSSKARGYVFAALIAKHWQVDTGEQMFTRAKQHRRNGEMHFVDQSPAKQSVDIDPLTLKPAQAEARFC